MAKVAGYVPVAGDCGHNFEVSFERIEDEFACPTCGHKDRFSEKQLAFIKEQIRATSKAG